MPKTRLELTWIGKDQPPRLEPRILIEDPEKSYHAQQRVTDHDLFDNRLIFGDNLLALKALEQEFVGQVKCVFIDPPYNTGTAFAQYDDGIEHSIWLGLMRDRLEIIHNLLSLQGSLWITIDDHEGHYLKVVCDEIFGRAQFLADVAWEKADSPRMDAEYFSTRHDHILVYAKDYAACRINRMPQPEDPPEHFSRRDDEGRPYYTKPLRAMSSRDDTRAARPSMFFPLTAPDGTSVYPIRPDGSDGRWRWGPERYEADKDTIDWVQGRNGWAPYYRIYWEATAKRPPETIWRHEDVGSNRTAILEQKRLFEGIAEPFATPKPEGLLERVINLATDRGDLVLDSFAGSGTTGAVAHKLGRRWIMVELGEHCHTHIIPRMQKVIDGEDPGGVTETADWQGGGGFRYYHLAPSLMEQDPWGNWVISRDYNSAMLAEAVCKLEGFRYEPSEEDYWLHGRSTERDFIYVTTQTLTEAQLNQLSLEIGGDRTLLVCCGAFRGRPDGWENLTLKKIPQAVLSRCEWGRDDYSLQIRDLPEAPREAPVQGSIFEGDEP